MLVDKKKFSEIEKSLTDKGIIGKFEKENGKIKGRMMITLTDIPDEVLIGKKQKSMHAFEGSFDFYDVTICVVVDVKTHEVVSPIWMKEQVLKAEHPNEETIDFFFGVLAKGITDNGPGFGYPMYTFLNDTNSFTLFPTMED